MNRSKYIGDYRRPIQGFVCDMPNGSVWKPRKVDMALKNEEKEALNWPSNVCITQTNYSDIDNKVVNIWIETSLSKPNVIIALNKFLELYEPI